MSLYYTGSKDHGHKISVLLCETLYFPGVWDSIHLHFENSHCQESEKSNRKQKTNHKTVLWMKKKCTPACITSAIEWEECILIYVQIWSEESLAY